MEDDDSNATITFTNSHEPYHSELNPLVPFVVALAVIIGGGMLIWGIFG